MTDTVTRLGYRRMGDPQGRPLALVHGWGCDSRFLMPVAAMFPERDVYLCDLPGYGSSRHLSALTPSVAEGAQAFLNTLPPHCDVIAWSMGAHYAILAASLPGSTLRTLVTICSSARFPSDPNWPGMSSDLILKCQHMLTPHRAGRLLRFFIKYQIAANSNQHHEMDFMNRLLDESELPDFQVLMDGINSMTYSDVRENLKHLNIPCLFLFGGKDVLVPAALSRTPAYQGNTLSSTYVFPDSAHVPYLTEPRDFEAQIRAFYDRVDTFLTSG